MTHPTTPKLPALLTLILTLSLSASASTVVFSDSMDYVDDAAIQAAWTAAVTGSNPGVATQTSYTPTPLSGLNPTPASGSFMTLNNGVRYRELGATLTDSWTFNVLIQSSSYSRSIVAYLLDSTGTEGYGIRFGTALVDQYNGDGYVRITKFDNSTYTDWSSFGTGTSLTAQALSNHPVTGYEVTSAPDSDQNNATYNTAAWEDFMELTLTWDSGTGTLTAYADGVEVGSATDTDFSSFSRVYLRGNTTSFFDEVVISTVPESGSAAFLLGGVALVLSLMVLRRRH